MPSCSGVRKSFNKGERTLWLHSRASWMTCRLGLYLLGTLASNQYTAQSVWIFLAVPKGLASSVSSTYKISDSFNSSPSSLKYVPSSWVMYISGSGVLNLVKNISIDKHCLKHLQYCNIHCCVSTRIYSVLHQHHQRVVTPYKCFPPLIQGQLCTLWCSADRNITFCYSFH